MLIIFILFAILVFEQVGDGITTLLALGHPDAKEANPIERWVISKLGVVRGLVISKLVLILLIGAVVLICGPRLPTATISTLGALAILYVFVLWNNVKVLGRL